MYYLYIYIFKFVYFYICFSFKFEYIYINSMYQIVGFNPLFKINYMKQKLKNSIGKIQKLNEYMSRI